MEPQPSIVSRAGRSFWTLVQGILNVVTSAVDRYLRPAPPNAGNDEINIKPEVTLCTERDQSHEEDKNVNEDEGERESRGDDAQTRETKSMVPWEQCEIFLETDSKAAQSRVEYIRSGEREQAEKETERSRKRDDASEINPMLVELNNKDAELNDMSEDEIQRGDICPGQSLLPEERKKERREQDRDESEDEMQTCERQREEESETKQQDIQLTDEEFKSGGRDFEIKTETVEGEYGKMEDGEEVHSRKQDIFQGDNKSKAEEIQEQSVIVGVVKKRERELEKEMDEMEINKSYREAKAEQGGEEQPERLEDTGIASGDGQGRGPEYEENEEILREGRDFTLSWLEPERETCKLEVNVEEGKIRLELETGERNEGMVADKGEEKPSVGKKGGEDRKSIMFSSELQRAEENEEVKFHYEDQLPQTRAEEHLTLGFDLQEVETHRETEEKMSEEIAMKVSGTQWRDDQKHEEQNLKQTEADQWSQRVHEQSGGEDEESETKQEEERKTDGEQIKIEEVEAGEPQEMDIDIKYKMAQAETEDEKCDDNEKETKCDEEEIPELGISETQMRINIKEPQDEENEEQFGWIDRFEATRERSQEEVRETQKPQEEMQGVQSAAELGREEQRVEEEEIADKPPESITREEGKESCEVGKSREFGEVEVYSSEFERGEEKDNEVENKDIEIHIEHQWPIQTRAEEHLTLGFDLQEMETHRETEETLPEEIAVEVSETQWRDDQKHEEQNLKQTEADQWSQRVHEQSGGEDEESETKQEEERKMDGEQIKIGDPKEMDTDIKNKLAQVEKEDEKDDDNEKETKCDKAEIPDLKVQDTELRMSFEEPRDEENEEQFGWTEEFEATRERGQESVTENKKPQEEMQGVQSAAELGREEQRVKEEEDMEKPKELEAANKLQESVTREESEEPCKVQNDKEHREMEVCLSEFEKGQENDTDVEEDTDPARWSVQSRSEEHLTLQFNLQELETQRETEETISEEKAAEVVGAQWRDGLKHEESGPKEKETETEHRSHRTAHEQCGGESEESDTNQMEERGTDGDQIKIEEVETGEPQEMDIDIKYKMAQAETEDEKCDDNEKETKCDEEEIPELGISETQMRINIKEPQDEENEEQFGWIDRFEATRERSQEEVRERSQEEVRETQKPQEEMQGVQSAAELGREEQRVEEEEIADKPPESITREEGKESCEVGKSREFGEVEVYSSEFERGEEKDNEVENKDIEIHIEHQWPIQTRAEEHLTLGFDLQEMETHRETEETLPEEIAVEVSETQWRDDQEHEESGPKEKETETEHRSHRTAHEQCGGESEESDTNQMEERGTDGDQIKIEEVETEEPQEMDIEMKYKITQVETEDEKVDGDEKETKCDNVEIRELWVQDTEMGISFKEPQDEENEEQSGWMDRFEATRERSQESVRENQKPQQEMQGVQSAAELGREEQTVEEEEVWEEIADKPPESVTREEGEESYEVEKGREVEEMDVCSSEFERGEEKDNEVEKEDIEILIECQWPIQARAEEHLTLGFDLQEVETHREAEETMSEKIAVEVSETQWKDDQKHEEQNLKQTEADQWSQRVHEQSGGEDEESEREQEEEKKTDGEQKDLEDGWSVPGGTTEHLTSGSNIQQFESTNKKAVKTVTEEEDLDVSESKWRDDRKHEESVYSKVQTESEESHTAEGQVSEEHCESDTKQKKEKEPDGQRDSGEMAIGGESQEINFEVKYKIAHVERDDGKHEENEEETLEIKEMNKSCDEPQDEIEREEKSRMFKNVDSRLEEQRRERDEMKEDHFEITDAVEEFEERKEGAPEDGKSDGLHTKDMNEQNVAEVGCREDDSRTDHVWEMQTGGREEQVALEYGGTTGQIKKGGAAEIPGEIETEEGKYIQTTVKEEDRHGGAEVFAEEEGAEETKQPSGERPTERESYVRQESEERMGRERADHDLVTALDINVGLAEDDVDKSASNERSGLAENKAKEDRKSECDGEMRAHVCETREKPEVPEARVWVVEEEKMKQKETDGNEVCRQEAERATALGEEIRDEAKRRKENEPQSQSGETLIAETPEEAGRSKRQEVGEETGVDVGNEDTAEDEVEERVEDEQTVYGDESKKFVLQVDAPSLDFTAQKSRIALKNRQVRPPRDPRVLLQKPSLVPLRSAPEVKAGPGGLMGIKLPGLGGAIPALKKTDRAVKERREEVTGQIGKAEETTQAGVDVREQISTKRWEAGPKAGGIGAIRVKLPAFGTGLPVLRKTDRGVKMREETSDEGTVGEGQGAESKEKEVKRSGAQAAMFPGFGAGFPVLKKTERGMKMRSGEHLEKSEADQDSTGADVSEAEAQSQKAGVGNPLLSELKCKLKKTDRK